MSTPYYSPSRRPNEVQQRDEAPYHANASSGYTQAQPQRPGTGPSEYHHSQDAPLGGDAPAFGTGTDGFGGDVSYGEPSGRGRHPSPYAQDYDHDYEQRGDRYTGQPPLPGQYNQPSYLTPVYDNTPQGSNMSLADEFRRFQQSAPYDQHQQQYLHQYPPQHSFTPSPGPYDRQDYVGGISRPDSPGIYLDRAPNMNKLNDAQKKIVREFPKDLDDKEGSMMKSAVSNVKDWRTWVKWKYTPYYIITIVVILLIAFLTVYHKQIVEWLTPTSKKVRSVAWGWIIPVIILFIISFPPLFGHEIVGILLGVVYGLWIGFGILSLGTLLGEWGNFYAFKHFLKKHAERYERTSLNYACMAYIVREGGFLVILLARLSAIPGHFTTAVFATVGMNFFMFTIATLLSMPKLLVVVYLGVAIESSGSGTESTQSKIIKYAVVLVSALVTVAVAFYLYGRMLKARPIVQARMQKKRYDMLLEAASGAPTSQSDDSIFAADESTAKLNEAGHYSTDMIHHPQVDQGKDQKSGSSRWKWGKKKSPGNESMHNLEEGKGNTIVMGNGLTMSMENKSASRFGLGNEERLGGQKMQYIKSSDSARSGLSQSQDHGAGQGQAQWRGQQEEAGYPPVLRQSAPPPHHDPYRAWNGQSPFTAPPHGPPGYHDGRRGNPLDPLTQQTYSDPRLR